MARRIALSGTVILAAFISCAILPPIAVGQKSDSEVKVTATATKPSAAGKQVLTIVMDHNKGWHTYANPVGNEDLSNNKTVVKVNAKAKPLDVKISYPDGKIQKDEIGEYRIYEGRTQIQVVVQRAQNDTSPLEVSVSMNACSNKGRCLLRGSVILNVP